MSEIHLPSGEYKPVMSVINTTEAVLNFRAPFKFDLTSLADSLASSELVKISLSLSLLSLSSLSLTLSLTLSHSLTLPLTALTTKKFRTKNWS